MHQAHVRKVQEAFPLKTGSGQELRGLHDLLSQHIRALKASEDYTIETYLTAAIELKLDEGTKLIGGLSIPANARTRLRARNY